MDGPLNNLLVIDLTRVLVGPYCTMILSDLGARVIKIEAPETGDDSRKFGPFIENYSAYFMSLNRGKESIALNLKNQDDKNIFDKILSKADILVENFKPGTLEKWGYGWNEVSKKYPKLIYASASGFGQTGPYSPRGGFDLIACGMSGLMSINGPPEGPPYRIPMPVSDVCGGMNGAIGILTALAARTQTGKGQHVDTSLFESGISLGVYEAANVFANGEVPERLGQAHRGSAPYQLFPTSDGYVTVGGAQDNFWRGTCKILKCEHLLEDARFKSKADRVLNNKELVPELEVFFKRQSTDKLCKAFDKAGIPAGPVMNHVEVFNDPQTIAREMVVEVEHTKIGKMKTIGVPIKLSHTPAKISRAAPLLGEHTNEVLEEWCGQ